MQNASIPAKFPIVFASSAPAGNVTNPIPTTAQGGGLVSFPTGWQQINFTPLASGGVPPWGKDFNGLFQIVTAWQQWNQAGGAIPYDAAFQAAVGGYPSGCIIGSAANPGLEWFSTVDNNLSNPDTGGAGWVAWPLVFYAADTGTTNALAASFVLPLAAMPIGTILWVNPAHNNTSGTPTLNINGAGGVTITTPTGGTIANGGIVTSIPAQIMVGTSHALWLMNPQAAAATSPARGAQSYLSPGVNVFTVPATTVTLQGWGPGGGGGGGYVDLGGSAGSGGGGGGYCFTILTGLTIGTGLTVTVGAGGAGGAGGGDGSTGSNTTVTLGGPTVLQANSGGGGTGGARGQPAQTGGAGGGAGAGYLNIAGQYGSPDYQSGGSSPGGGQGGVANNFGNVYAATGPGGGGAAGYNNANPGGTGANGGVLITW